MKTPKPFLLLGAAALSMSCQPDLPLAPALAEQAGASGELIVSSEPPGPLDGVPEAVWFRLRAPGTGLDPAQLFLIEGDVGPGHLAQLERGQISHALEERLVPAAAWSGAADELWLAPFVPLERGARYGLANAAPSSLTVIDVSEDDPLPWLSHVWPPDGRSTAAPFAVWCGAIEEPPWSQPLTLEPGAMEAELSSGAALYGQGRGCVQLSADRVTEATLATPPALLDADGSPRARLEPAALVSGEPAAAVVPLICEPGEIVVGPGCGSVEDDRMRLRTPQAPLLWMIADGQANGGLEQVEASAGEPLWVHPLRPASTSSLRLLVMDRGGQGVASNVSVTTAPPMPHLVLNEVLANAIGPEPEQEWVEIYNDGLAAAALGGWRLADIGGEVELPEVVLPAGGYAVLVNDDYDASGKYDPAPAPEAMVLRVPKLGKNGLSNEGEPLELIDPGGVIRSQFPAHPKPKAGRSVLRVSPLASDDDPASFVLSEEAQSTPGAVNAP